MARRTQKTQLSPPFLKRIWIDDAAVAPQAGYPFSLPMFRRNFDLSFARPITILVGENGSGKSTLLEGIAALVGFNPDGGGVGYGAVRDAGAVDINGDALAPCLRAAWLPKINRGFFFRAETFFTVARFLDAAGSTSADFLSHSHGEGFLRFFAERCAYQGIYIFDEPEAALSPARQIDFLRLLRQFETAGVAQIIIATHSPLLMAHPGAQLLQLVRGGIVPTSLEQTDHFRLMREFTLNPRNFLDTWLDDGA